MIRAARFALSFVGSLIIVGIGSVLLAILGRASTEPGQELVVDSCIDSDDPGVDIDEEERHL